MGGAGCSSVCASTSFFASTQRLPFVSYGCPAASLSDTTTYPELTRFGTVTTAAVDVIADINKIRNNSWTEITVISGDPAKYRTEAESMRDAFIAKGFSSNYEYATDNQWEDILSMMEKLKEASKGKNRIYFFIGTEDHYRQVVCASIVAKSEKGITWLSRGSWPDDWWKKSHYLSGQNRQWLLEDAGGSQLRGKFKEFKAAWEAYALNVSARTANERKENRRIALQKSYITEELEKLDRAEGSEQYHAVHAKWHPTYRQILYARDYYDIFLFDLSGDLIYSAHKGSDFATNFAENGNGQWKDSGLGDAFRTAIRAPDNVTYIDWKPYGPNNGKMAAFLSTGIRDEDGKLLGVYAIELPSTYKRSIEEMQEECTLEAITESFEGAINVVGLGRPTDENMHKPLPCFEGYDTKNFSKLLDQHIIGGYPLGDKSTQVVNPYSMIKANAADAVCAVAFTVRHLLDQGHTIEEIQKPGEALYAKYIDYFKTKMDFQGASGQVKFSGNDRPIYLTVQQVQYGSNVDIGLVSPLKDGSPGSDDSTKNEAMVNITWQNGGPSGRVWTKEPADPPPVDNFPYWTLKVFVPVILLCSPTIAGLISGWRAGTRELQKTSGSTLPTSTKKEKVASSV